MEEDQKKNIAVIGDEEFTLGFQLAGVQKTFGEENYRQDLKDLMTREDIGIVVAKKQDIEELPEKLRKNVESSVDPVVVPLSEEAGIAGLQEKIKNVIGIDIS